MKKPSFKDFWGMGIKNIFNPPKLLPPTYYRRWFLWYKNTDGDYFYDWNIYGDKWTKREWSKRFLRFHRIAKYQILYPASLFLRMVIGRNKNDQPRPHRAHDRNLVAFNKAWDKSIEEWMIYYFWPTRIAENPNMVVKGSPEYKKLFDVAMNDLLIQQIKDFYITSCTQDTAYRELHNILMFNIAIEMNQEYQEAKPKHLFYGNDDICDVDYLHITERMFEKKIKIESMKEEQAKITAHWLEDQKQKELDKINEEHYENKS